MNDLRKESSALVRVEADLYRSYKALCGRRGVSIASEVRAFMQSEVARYDKGGLAAFNRVGSGGETFDAVLLDTRHQAC